MTILHNPRCGKSRAGLSLLEQSGNIFTIRKYLENPLTKKELEDILMKSGLKPLDIVRTKEPIWKEHFSKKKLNDEEIIDALCKYPILLERPIVFTDSKAVIGRPTENILKILH